MTAGQRLRLEGRQEGRLEGERSLLLRLLRKRFGDAVTSDVIRHIEAASSEQLGAWFDGAATGASLAELFGHA